MDSCLKMVKDRKAQEEILNREIETPQDAVEYAEALTKIIWNHKMLGLIYEYYDSSILYKGHKGKELSNLDDIVKEFLSIQAAFPDLQVQIVESFAQKREDESYAIYQRSYSEGTNLGVSKYGQPTKKKLTAENSLGQTVYFLKKANDNWKVFMEYSNKSQNTIEDLLNDKTDKFN